MISVSFSCEPDDLFRLIESLLVRLDTDEATLTERLASMDAAYAARIGALEGLRDGDRLRLNEHDRVLSRHDSEIESLLEHDHVHPQKQAQATPDSEVALPVVS